MTYSQTSYLPFNHLFRLDTCSHILTQMGYHYNGVPFPVKTLQHFDGVELDHVNKKWIWFKSEAAAAPNAQQGPR